MKPTFVLFIAALLTACDDTVVGNPGPPASMELTVSSADAMTSAGDTRTVTAVTRDDRHAVIAAPTLVWSSSAPAVATVTGTGTSATVTAVDDGVATITAESGSIRGTVTVTVRRALATVILTAPAPTLVFGSSVQLTATALDARQHPLPGATGFTFETNNSTSTVVTQTGLVTALFQFPQLPDAVITARLTRDGVTASGSTGIRVGGPPSFDFGSLMLTDYVVPRPVPTRGAGLAYLSRKGANIDFVVTWSGLSGAATAVQIRGPGGESDIADLLVDFGALEQVENYGTITGSLTPARILPQGGRAAITVDSLATLLCNRNAYFEVRTSAFSSGEIRGASFCRGG